MINDKEEHGVITEAEYLEAVRKKARITMKDEKKTINYLFSEDKLCEELLEYINKTYQGHYSGKYQATEMIIDAGHGIGFCVGNIMKYAKRYGKKQGYNKADIMKMLHYAIILLHVHNMENEKE